MSPDWQIDDDTIEAIVRGEASCEGWLSPVVSFARQVQEIGSRARPAPSADLLALFDGTGAAEIPSGFERSVELASVAAPVAGPLAAAEQARHSLGDGPGEPARGSGLAEGITLDLLGDVVEGAVPSTLDEDEDLDRSSRRRSLLGAATAAISHLRSMPRAAVATAAGVAVVMVAGLTGVAPQSVTAFVRATVSTVTPFDLTDDSDDPAADVRTDPDPRDDKSPVEADDTPGRADEDEDEDEAPAEATPEPESDLDLPDSLDDRSGADEQESTSEQPAPEPVASTPPPTAAPEPSDGSDTSGTGLEIPENPWWPPPESDGDGGWADGWTDGWPAP
jgi:hypothetical protein